MLKIVKKSFVYFYSMSTLSCLGLSINPLENLITQFKDAQLWHENSPLRLHLGCGECSLPGYINIDYPPSEHTVQQTSAADIFANIITLQYPSQTIDEIRSHHVFEHFNRQTALALLCNWHQALKIGGTLVIETPDFEESAKLIISDYSLSYTEKQAILRHIFGSHEAAWAVHCDGWYQEKFLHILSLFEFEEITIAHSRYLNLYNITVTAKKTKHLSKEILLDRAKVILQESLVADCETKMYQVWLEQLCAVCSYNAPIIRGAYQLLAAPRAAEACRPTFQLNIQFT
jgi:predicted SAM-dependent methyltransferase